MSFGRFSYLLVLLLLGFSPILAQKNVLFIAVDDLKPDLGCYGDSLALTPNIDALAAEGIIFTKAYCQQAVCAPSRASLLTGRYPDQTRVFDLQTMLRKVAPGITSLPEYLISKGYNTSATGKIFDPRSVDADRDAASWSRSYMPNYDARLYDPVYCKPSYFYASDTAKDSISKIVSRALLEGLDKDSLVKALYFPSTENADVPYDAYVDGAILNAGLELMDEMTASGQPFFLAVGFHRPHLPFAAPEKYWNLYERESIPLATFQERALNSPDIAYHNSEELRSYTDIPSSGSLDTAKQKELIHGYYAATSYIDDLVGMLITHLDELNIRDSTIIVLWGDHGWHLGDHELWCKHSNFEQATRVPLIFSVPGQAQPGAKSAALVEFTDIASTLVDLCDIDLPEFFEGESLVPLFQDPQIHLRKGALSQYPRWSDRMGYSLRTERYRYTKWLNGDGSLYARELYDYLLDPNETRSLISDPGQSDLILELDSLLNRRIEIPSTQPHIQFQLYGISREGDTTRLDQGEAELLGVQRSMSNGLITFTHIPGQYSFHARSKGYQSFENSIEVNGDTVISVFLEQEYYQVAFQLIQAWNGQVHEGANVSFGSLNGLTDSSGIVRFDQLPYVTDKVYVEYLNGAQQEFSAVEVFSDTLIQLYLEQAVYNLSITLIDALSGNPVSAAEVFFDGESRSTDYSGKAVYSTISGSYGLIISKDYYKSFSDTLVFDKDSSLLIEFWPTHNTMSVWVTGEGSPLKEASVSIDTNTIVTASLGLAKFENLPVRSTYNVVVSKEGYEQVSGEFYLYRDTAVYMDLSMVGLTEQYTEKFFAWPNPASTELFFHLLPDQSGTMKIYNTSGILLLEDQVLQGTGQLDVSALPEGVYILFYSSNQSFIYQKLLIRREKKIL